MQDVLIVSNVVMFRSENIIKNFILKIMYLKSRVTAKGRRRRERDKEREKREEERGREERELLAHSLNDYTVQGSTRLKPGARNFF